MGHGALYSDSTVDLGEASQADDVTKFYCEMANVSYADQYSKPSFLLPPLQIDSESWLSQDVQILYELISTPVQHPNLTMYKPIQHNAVAPNHAIPVYVILKGTDLTNFWELYLDVNMFLDYTTSGWFTTKFASYFTEMNLICDFLVAYIQANPNAQLSLIGHSLGCRFATDISVRLTRDEGLGANVQSLRLFNPFIFPGSPNYQYMFIQASGDGSAAPPVTQFPHWDLYHNKTFFYIIKSDFASVFIRGPYGFGHVYTYNNASAGHENLNFDAVTTLSQWMSVMSLGNTRQAFADIQNHKLNSWTDQYPQAVAEAYNLGATNEIQAFQTDLSQLMGNYGFDPSVNKHMWLWNDTHTQGNPSESSKIKVNIMHNAPTDRAYPTTTFTPVLNYAGRNTYFRYSVTVGPTTTQYVAFKMSFGFYTQTVEQFNTNPDLHTGTLYSTKYFYVILVGDPTGSGINKWLLGQWNENTGNMEPIRIKSGSWNDHNSGNWAGLNPNGVEIVAAAETYAQYLALSYSTATSKKERFEWRTNDVQGLDAHGRRDNPVIPPSQTTFESMFNIAAGSGITQFNTYIKSSTAWYIDGNILDGTNPSGVSGLDRFMFSSAINTEYYSEFQGSTVLSAQSANGVQGNVAVSPDSEVWNITYSESASKWLINNTQITPPSGNSMLAYWDVGAWAAYYSASNPNAAENGFHGVPYSSFPLTRDIEVKYHSTVGTDRMYTISFLEGAVEQFLINTTRSYSQSNGKYSYIELVSQTFIDSHTSLDIVPACLFKLADNVNTGGGI